MFILHYPMLIYIMKLHELPDEIKTIGEYLELKSDKKESYVNSCDCNFLGGDKNILILTPVAQNISFIDKGFKKNDSIGIKTNNKFYEGVIKELYHRDCFVQINGPMPNISYGFPISIYDNSDISFLYENMYHAFKKIFYGEDFSQVKDFLIKLYSSKKSVNPNQLDSLHSTPPSKELLNYFFNNKLNEYQKELVSASINLMSNKENLFYLGFGPPGCGKTEAITEIALQCIKRKKRLLITSFTNVAVDNVIERLIKLNPQDKQISTLIKKLNISSLKNKIVRVGSERNIKVPAVAEVSLQRKLLNERNIKRDTIINSCYIVGATLDMLGTPIFDKINPFDIMVVDEASMIESPKLFLGLVKTKKFVLIGDPYQLQPFLGDDKKFYNNNDILNRYKKSLEYPIFKKAMDLLFESNNSNYYTQLRYHYRSPEEIIRFSNDMFYEGRLICKTPKSKANKYSKLFDDYGKNHCNLIKKVFNSKNKVIWVDTTGIPSISEHHCEWRKNEYSKTRSCCNISQAALDILFLKHFLDAFWENDTYNYKGTEYRKRIGIISPFNYQVDLLQKYIFEHPDIDPYFRHTFSKPDPIASIFEFIEIFNLLDELEIATVHKYQGREKDIIIFDLTYWGDKKSHALNNENELNVALTRPKIKLIIVGSFFNIKSDFIDLLYDSKKYVVFAHSYEHKEDINTLIEPLKNEYDSICDQLEAIIKERERTPYSLSERIGKMSDERIIREIADYILRKYPNFTEKFVYKKVSEKIKMLEKLYWDVFPERLDVVAEKERFDMYVHSEIKEEYSIEKEVALKFGEIDKIGSIDNLSKLKAFLQQKMSQLDKNTYLFQGLKHIMLKLEKREKYLMRKANPEIGKTIFELSFYISNSNIPEKDWRNLIKRWAEKYRCPLPSTDSIKINIDVIKNKKWGGYPNIPEEGDLTYDRTRIFSNGQWRKRYTWKEKTVNNKRINNFPTIEIGNSLDDLAEYIVQNNLPESRWKDIMDYWAKRSKVRRPTLNVLKGEVTRYKKYGRQKFDEAVLQSQQEKRIGTSKKDLAIYLRDNNIPREAREKIKRMWAKQNKTVPPSDKELEEILAS